MLPQNFKLKKLCRSKFLSAPEDTIANYPLAGGQRETHGCVFQGKKTCGIATNIYLRKTLEKPKVGL